jgi:uncharacterized Fe-S cluster-containing radical SAM superfamily protein
MTSSTSPCAPVSPFVSPAAPALHPGKFRDPRLTLDGARRARVAMTGLSTLWFNTGTLCNIACANCYIASSPRNDALVYLSARDVEDFLVEAGALDLPVRQVGFTGGEPFMNRDIIAMLEAALCRDYRALVLTNGMRPMRRFEAPLLALRDRFGEALTLRVSLDHHTRAVHEAERGPGAWAAAIGGLEWLAAQGFSLAVAGRRLIDEQANHARAGYGLLFASLGLGVDADDPARLVLFPEMDRSRDTPEITHACWDVLQVSPASMMCATSRMVVKRRGASAPAVVACTLTSDDRQFELGPALADALGEVALNHPHCSRFCVLGGASCSGP